MARAQRATSIDPETAEVAVHYLQTHHDLPVGKFGPWGIKYMQYGSVREGSSPFAYGIGRVPTEVINELDRRGFVFADEDADTEMGDEVKLTIENESSLYPMRQSIEQNLAKKMEKGTYDRVLGVQGWRHFANVGAKAYLKDWGVKVDVPTRDYIARQFAREFEGEYEVQHANPHQSRNPSTAAASRIKNPHGY